MWLWSKGFSYYPDGEDYKATAEKHERDSYEEICSLTRIGYKRTEKDWRFKVKQSH